MQSKKVVLLNRPVGALKETDMGVFDETLAPLESGEVLLEIEHLSVDAFIRTTFDEGRLMARPGWVRPSWRSVRPVLSIAGLTA